MNSLLTQPPSRTSAASSKSYNPSKPPPPMLVSAATAPSLKKDPRQTITPIPPPASASTPPLQRRPRQRPVGSTSSSSPPLPSTTTTSGSSDAVEMAKESRNDAAMRPHVVKSKSSPKSAAKSNTSSNKSPRSSRRGRSSKKPPLSSCHKYYSRSVMSEATNSTYLSSDSEEDHHTVHSDSFSAHSGSQRSGGTGSSLHSLGSKSSSRLSSDAHPDLANDISSALVPYEPPPQSSTAIDNNKSNTNNNRRSRSAALEPHRNRKHVDGDGRSTSTILSRRDQSCNNADNKYYPYQRPQQRRPIVSSDIDDLAEMEANVFSYSDEDDQHIQYHENNRRHYRSQGEEQHYISNNVDRQIIVSENDDSSVGILSCGYSDDDDIDPEEELYERDDDEDSATLADLDQLIQETSARWKLSVTETVKKSVSSSSNTTSSTIAHHYHPRSDSIATTTVPSQLSTVAGIGSGAAITEEDLRLSSSTNASSKTVDPSTLLAVNGTSQLQPSPCGMTKHHHANGDSSPSTVLPTAASQLIEEQQAQIAALRAALSRQEKQRPQQVYCALPQQQLPPSTTESSDVHPIQVLTVSSNHVECTDDLTVWSGFHSAVAPPLPRRPDAASVVGDSYNGKGNNSDNDPLSSSPPMTGSSLTRVTRHLELSSSVTGMTRTAIFTGTLAGGSSSNNKHSNNNNHVTGTGVLQFVETGDIYRGDIVNSEMHGFGSYTFAAASSSSAAGVPSVLCGRFEHNVFVG